MAKVEHVCPVCDKTFSRAQHTVRHLRTHTGERPYVCRVCDETFQRADMLTRHRMKNHPSDEVFAPALQQAKAVPQAAHADHPRAEPSGGEGRGGRYERQSKYSIMATELEREMAERTTRRDSEQAQMGFSVDSSSRVLTTYPTPPLQRTNQPFRPPQSYRQPTDDQASFLPHLDASYIPHFAQELPVGWKNSLVPAPSTLAALQQYVCPPQPQPLPAVHDGETGRSISGSLDFAGLGFPNLDALSSAPWDPKAGDEIVDKNGFEMLDSWVDNAASTAWNRWGNADAAPFPPMPDHQMTDGSRNALVYPEVDIPSASDASATASSNLSESNSTPSTATSITLLAASTSTSTSFFNPLLLPTNRQSTQVPSAFENYSSSLRVFAAAVLSSLPTPSILVQSMLPASSQIAFKSRRLRSPPPSSVAQSLTPPLSEPAFHLDLALPAGWRVAAAATAATAEPKVPQGLSIMERRKTRKAENLVAVTRAGGGEGQTLEQAIV